MVLMFSLVAALGALSVESKCLCVFGVDRTLTAKQGTSSRCPGAKEYDGVFDSAFAGGTLVLSELGENLKNTFCGQNCYNGILTAGSASDDESKDRHVWDVLLSKFDKSGNVRNVGPSLPGQMSLVVSAWDHLEQDRPSAVVSRFSYAYSTGFNDEDVYFFDARQEKVKTFEGTGFNALQVSCSSRDPHMNNMTGYCGGLLSEVVQRKGVHLCSETSTFLRPFVISSEVHWVRCIKWTVFSFVCFGLLAGVYMHTKKSKVARETDIPLTIRNSCCDSERMDIIGRHPDVEAYLRADPKASLKDSSVRVRENFSCVLAAVEGSGQQLQYASMELKDEENIVLVALKADGKQLKFVSNRLRGQKRIIMAALKQDDVSALEHADFSDLAFSEKLLLAFFVADLAPMSTNDVALKRFEAFPFYRMVTIYRGVKDRLPKFFFMLSLVCSSVALWWSLTCKFPTWLAAGQALFDGFWRFCGILCGPVLFCLFVFGLLEHVINCKQLRGLHGALVWSLGWYITLFVALLIGKL